MMGERIEDLSILADLVGLDESDQIVAGDRSWSIRHGRVDSPRGTVLLLAGLGMHRIEWSAELVGHLQRAGYETLTVDNHDAGRSQFRTAAAHYELRDLALDHVGLLDALGIETAHVVGISMGGMLAQHFALGAPERTATLTSLASTTGRRGVGRPAQDVKWIFTTSLPTEREAYLEYARQHHTSITSASHRDMDRAVWLAEQIWERGIDAGGYARQLSAIGADGDRSQRLTAVAVPTLVLHGADDPMIDVSGGRDTADAIPGSIFTTIPGMGHVVTWQSAELIAEHLVTHFGRGIR